MITQNLGKILKENAYPGRGIVIGKSDDGKYAVTAYFIMGRSVNSRNRVFTATEDGIKTEAFDPSLLTDPHLIIYSPVRVLGNKTIVTNGDQTDTIYELMDKQMTFEPLCNSPDAYRYPRSYSCYRRWLQCGYPRMPDARHLRSRAYAEDQGLQGKPRFIR